MNVADRFLTAVGLTLAILRITNRKSGSRNIENQTEFAEMADDFSCGPMIREILLFYFSLPRNGGFDMVSRGP